MNPEIKSQLLRRAGEVKAEVAENVSQHLAWTACSSVILAVIMLVMAVLFVLIAMMVIKSASSGDGVLVASLVLIPFLLFAGAINLFMDAAKIYVAPNLYILEKFAEPVKP